MKALDHLRNQEGNNEVVNNGDDWNVVNDGIWWLII